MSVAHPTRVDGGHPPALWLGNGPELIAPRGEPPLGVRAEGSTLEHRDVVDLASIAIYFVIAVPLAT